MLNFSNKSLELFSLDTKEVSHVELLLRPSETVLLNKLGSWRFQMNNYGEYDPDVILKIDFEEIGEEAYEWIIEQVKEPICELWNKYANSDIFDDSQDVFFFIIAIILGANIPYYAATFFCALLIKRGLNKICKP
jgi:hypothetical protein